MKTVNNESMILDIFSDTSFRETLIIGNHIKCGKLFRSIKCFYRRKNWIDSSAKNYPPPDFYNIKLKMMMDVMRLDDSSFVDSKGKVQNPVLQNENKLLKKYFGSNYKNERNDISCFVIASSGLPSDEDHNFQRYFENFKRVIKKHCESIELYKENHPGYQVVFFLYDESTAYMEVHNPELFPKKKGMPCSGKPHIQFCDTKFLEVLNQTNADYFIWYTPNKLIEIEKGMYLNIPKCAIIQNSKIPSKYCMNYDHSKLKSTEV